MRRTLISLCGAALLAVTLTGCVYDDFHHGHGRVYHSDWDGPGWRRGGWGRQRHRWDHDGWHGKRAVRHWNGRRGWR